MAPFLFTTCRHQAATLLFRQDSTFRFSSDFDWCGIQGFPSAIGPREISLIRALEVFIPLRFMSVAHDSGPAHMKIGGAVKLRTQPK
jgi:hypothetical protein